MVFAARLVAGEAFLAGVRALALAFFAAASGVVATGDRRSGALARAGAMIVVGAILAVVAGFAGGLVGPGVLRRRHTICRHWPGSGRGWRSRYCRSGRCWPCVDACKCPRRPHTSSVQARESCPEEAGLPGAYRHAALAAGAGRCRRGVSVVSASLVSRSPSAMVAGRDRTRRKPMLRWQSMGGAGLRNAERASFRVIVKVTAAPNSVRFRGGANRIRPYVAFVSILIPVPNPLPNIPAHIVEPPGTCRFLCLRDASSSLSPRPEL